jgi:DNA-binding response OmpR family regulator
MSGYTDDEVLRLDVSRAGSWYLQKPFSPDALARKVREALDTPRDAVRALA